MAHRNAEAILRELAAIVGEANLVADERLAAYSARGERPLAAAFPANGREAAAVAGLASAERIPVVVWGGGTQQGVEPVQPREGIVLGTRRLDTTVELDAANLTVTVGAGKVLDCLQQELAAVRLFLPLDPPDSARSTVGGALATNSSGPNRLLYRTARDLVLGLRVATPAGKEIRVGGKTVKDVAGYDLKKLYIGAWGTLGAITEATFRLLPRPEASATVAMVFPWLSGACAAVAALLASPLRPSAADLLSHDTLPDGTAALAAGQPSGSDRSYSLAPQPGEYLLLVQVEGAAEAVERQRRDLLALADSMGARDATVLEGEAERQLWQRRKNALATLPTSEPALLVKGSVLLKRLFDFAAGLVALEREQGLRVSLACHAGNGIVHGLIASPVGQEARLVAAAEEACRLAADCGGFALVRRAPPGIAGSVPVWPHRSDYGIMKALKAQLDPGNLWSPARTPGG